MSRTAFAIAAGITLLVAFAYLVVLPGVSRGGWVEVIGVLALVGVAILVERWLRSR